MTVPSLFLVPPFVQHPVAQQKLGHVHDDVVAPIFFLPAAVRRAAVETLSVAPHELVWQIARRSGRLELVREKKV